MGREVKRVPIAFDWPMNKPWWGYLLMNPYCKYFEDNCKACDAAMDSVGMAHCPRIAVEPPSGEAYQIWETVSEGSPITPPLATPESLADYCANNQVSAMGSTTLDRDTWLRFIKSDGWAPSLVGHGLRLMSGVEFVATKEDDHD